MSKPRRKLPNGEYTTDVDKYVDTWKYEAAPIETILGWRLCSMDPNYTFEDQRGQRINMTVGQVGDVVLKLISPKPCGWCGQEKHTSSCYERKLNAIRKALDEIDDYGATEDAIREILNG